jgi:uncharacterized protein with PIN domain
VIHLDAYGMIALLVEEPAAGEVEALLREDEEVSMSPVNLAEAIDVSERVHGLGEAEVRAAIELLLHDRIRVVGTVERHAWRAAELRLKHYHRRTMPLSLADCFLLASAGVDDRLATADEPIARAARAEGIAVVPLPDTSGRRP